MTGWVLVTGAAKRIGRSIALEFASHGWDVIVHYHKSLEEAQCVAEEIENLGQNACLAEIDLSESRLVESLIPSLAEELGMIDALINNAALFEPDIEDREGKRHWAINADAPRILSKSFRDHLPKEERGAIINLLDASEPSSLFSEYTKSKSFLAEMTRNMARSFAPQVRVNAVAPQYVFPSVRQSEDSFRSLAGDRVQSPDQVAIAVRRGVEDLSLTGQIVPIGGKAS